MNANVIVSYESDEYTIKATYSGTNVSRYWNDHFLKKSIEEAVTRAGTDKDLFDYCGFIFAQVDNAVRRRYGGREIIVHSITVSRADKAVISYQ